jgi:hypothetical protein
MKKLFALLVVAGMVSFVACGPKGPSKEEIAKRIADSTRKADSIAKVEADAKAAQELAAKEAEAKRIADSIANADKNKKPIKKTTKPVVKPNTKLPGKG